MNDIRSFWLLISPEAKKNEFRETVSESGPSLAHRSNSFEEMSPRDGLQDGCKVKSPRNWTREIRSGLGLAFGPGWDHHRAFDSWAGHGLVPGQFRVGGRPGSDGHSLTAPMHDARLTVDTSDRSSVG